MAVLLVLMCATVHLSVAASVPSEADAVGMRAGNMQVWPLQYISSEACWTLITAAAQPCSCLETLGSMLMQACDCHRCRLAAPCPQWCGLSGAGTLQEQSYQQMMAQLIPPSAVPWLVSPTTSATAGLGWLSPAAAT